MKQLALCDIDGCLLDCMHRLDLIMKGDFENGWEDDTVLPAGFKIYSHLLQDPEVQVVFNTARPERNRATTQKALSSLFPKATWQLWMRPDNDKTPDEEMKVAQLFKHGYKPEDVLIVFDDRNIICEAFRSLGVTAYQTATGY
jgi:hypothetical protein